MKIKSNIKFISICIILLTFTGYTARDVLFPKYTKDINNGISSNSNEILETKNKTCNRFHSSGESNYILSEVNSLIDSNGNKESFEYKAKLKLFNLNANKYLAVFEFIDTIHQKGNTSKNVLNAIKSFSGSKIYFETNNDFSIKAFSKNDENGSMLFWKKTLERLDLSILKNQQDQDWVKAYSYNNEKTELKFNLRSCVYNKQLKIKDKLNVKSVYQVNRKGYLSYLNLSEKILSTINGYELLSDSFIKINYLSSRALSEKERKSLLASWPKTFTKLNSSEALEIEIFKRELDGWSLNEVLSLFDGNMDAATKQKAYFKLLSWIYLNPDKLHSVEEELRNYPKDGSKVAVISSALLNSKRPEAQLVLKNSIEYYLNYNETYTSTLMNDLSLFENPSVENSKIFEKVLKNSRQRRIKNQALYNLGTYSDKLSSYSPENADRVVDSLINRYNETSKLELKTLLIGSLGNTKSSRSLEIIEKALSSEDEFLKAEAYLALRGIDDSTVDKLLSKGLINESSSVVKDRILNSISERNNSTNLLDLANYLEVERNAALRSKTYSIIIEMYLEISPEKVITILDKGLEREKDEELLEKLSSIKDKIESYKTAI